MSVPANMEAKTMLSNFRDFLQLYNKISEICFSHCVNNFNTRTAESDEINCMEKCLMKYVKTNNRIMVTYVEVQSAIMNKRVEEINAASAQLPPPTQQVPINENQQSVTQ